MPLKFYLSNKQDRYGDYSIRCSWCFQGIRVQTTIGYGASANIISQGDGRFYIKRGCKNGRCVPYNHINSRIDAIFHKVEEFEIEHLRNLENGTTLKEMRTVIAEAIGRKNRHKQINTASLLINKFITSGVANKHWRENTVKKFGTMKHHLETFNENLKINDIDET